MVPATAISVATFCSAATAADLPARKAPVAYVAPAFSWTGFYAGVNAGYAWNDSGNFQNVDVNSTVIPGFSRAGDGFDFLGNSKSGSFTGGGQIGYNYQMGNVVLGLEADINYAGVKKSYAAGGDRFGAYHDVLSADGKVEWFGTVRPRLGFLTSDRLMIFVTGGLAYGEVKTSAGINDYDYGTGARLAGINGSKSETRTGYTVGGGVEYALTSSVSLKGEYSYVDLGSTTHRFYDNDVSYPGAGLYVIAKDDVNFHVVRAGLNYKF
ncbi:Opacity protein antigens OS=Afipia felis OX=1035 GN=NCTC12722_01138 PE=3 SV=1 [Afipia felis]